jgi:hypothetical protein
MKRQWQRVTALATAGLAMSVAVMMPLDARQAPDGCRVSGRATSGTTPLPGVAVILRAHEAVKAATSTEPDGRYQVNLPAGVYRLSAELTGFTRIERDVSMEGQSCPQTVDLQLSIAPRLARTTAVGARPAAPPQPGATRGAQRFESLAIEQQTAVAGLDGATPQEREGTAAAALLLPPGFSTEGPTQAVAINGNTASIDRGMFGDRLDAIGRGEFDPATGEFGQGFGPGQGGPAGPGQGGPGGPGRGGPGGREGGPGPGGFFLGGRGRGQNAYNIQSHYSLGGSMLDSAPYQLRPDSPVDQRPYMRQNFGVTAGGPVRLPGYNGGRRTTFTAAYGGTRGGNLFDQYATVPSMSVRAGDFSSMGTAIVDPLTGQAFTGNRIPLSRMDSASLALLRFIPEPNLPGSSRNFHFTTTTDSVSDNVSLRVTHAFTQPQAGRGGGRGGPGAAGMRGGAVGRGGRQQATSITMTAQLQYRRNDNEQINVFPALGGQSTGSSFTLPVTVNVMHRRTMHNVNVNWSRTESQSMNQYAGVEDVAGNAGIIGVATDPFAWGVPQLSFSGFSSVRDLTPSRRTDRRLSIGYGWSRPFSRHTLRMGGDVRLDGSDSQTDSNAAGAFVFTGLYSAGGADLRRGDGLDFADFLLGLPQHATVQYGPGRVRMSGKSMSLYAQDDWRTSATLTFNLGLRYELLWPFVEQNGRMVNLDVAPGFSAAAPVVSGGTGLFSGAFPDALIRADTNNIAPRVGVAWRARPGTVLRGGYGVSYNSGSYAAIARQLVGQPPFALTNTSIGTVQTPLALAAPLATASPAATTNSFGVDRDYALGLVQTWNADMSRDINQAWNVGAGYVHTRGSSLDIVRAPNRGPEGLRIEGVQPFLWQTSEGSSVLHAATFRARRRPVKGLGGGVTYTLARSRDNASAIGGGTTVAQDDRNLSAEWGLSSFDRRHQLTADLGVELPFGPDRPWLGGGGTWASLLRDWRMSTTFTWQSGTPYSARVQGAVSDVARGTNGTLRADYNGQPIQLADPTIDLFFNTSAFLVPAPGAFGSSGRNVIIGPGSRQLNAQLSRDIRMGGNRALTIQLNATNLVNMVNYGAIDAVVNSPTFGQVTSVRGMRSTQLNFRFRF